MKTTQRGAMPLSPRLRRRWDELHAASLERSIAQRGAGEEPDAFSRLGWQRCGEIPGYALWPQGGLCSTTVFYRVLTD